ncbi:MAG TPA: glycosyltransferase family 39 protein [Isosphaeraceae bacterium]|jgi:4-amino-4-deoxy-L-arabinose transferase-like glycosyltransferase|nr:glycosyltransferase family 39 protein [Isosphaeraceae bacterium]
MTPRRALLALIVGSTLLRLAWAATLGPDTNEAYYYLYTQHPAPSYFDHPPMVAIVSAAGLMLSNIVSPVFAIRLGFIALFAGSTWLMARLTTRAFGSSAWAGVLAAFALNVTGYFGLVVGTSSTPDGPLLFFWLLTLDRLAVALEEPPRLSTWLWVGLAWGGALLSKYHAVLLPAGVVLYLLLRPSARRCLRSPGPYVAAMLGMAVFAPVILWNAEHAWISFLFQSSRGVGQLRLRPDRLAEALGAEALFVLPWIWLALVGALVRLLRRGPQNWSEPETFLVCQALPALMLFHIVASTRWIMPHWPLIGLVALMPILGRAWSESLIASPGPEWRRLSIYAITPVVVAGLIAAQARFGLFQDAHGRLLGLVAPQNDPTIDLIGWDQIARELERQGLLDDPGTFLFTSSWRKSAQLGFATRMRADVACYEPRARSFAFWSEPEDWVGRDGIFVRVDDDPADAKTFARWFTRIEPLGEFPILRANVPVETVHLYRCIAQTEPFPFIFSTQLTERHRPKPKAATIAHRPLPQRNGKPPRF